MKVRYLGFILLGLLSFSCAERYTTVYVETKQPEVVVEEGPQVDEVQEEIDSLVNEENEYRAKLGNTILSPGLSCKLYTITGGQRIQATVGNQITLQGKKLVASFLQDGPFNQEDSSINEGMNVLPEPLMSLYKNMYYLRCEGSIVVLDSDYYEFSIRSDDGSLLYIGGEKVVDNDNNHSPTTVAGQKFLRRGVHSFKLEYAQSGGGSQALVLKSNGSLVDGNVLYH